MKKKIIIFIAVIITIIVVATLTLTNMFTKGVITGKLYRVDNVYEEIYNMVIAERNGAETVLTTSIEGSEVDYDLGCFGHVNIPVNDEYAVVLSFVNQPPRSRKLLAPSTCSRRGGISEVRKEKISLSLTCQ